MQSLRAITASSVRARAAAAEYYEKAHAEFSALAHKLELSGREQARQAEVLEEARSMLPFSGVVVLLKFAFSSTFLAHTPRQAPG
jgi:hypothetical protein